MKKAFLLTALLTIGMLIGCSGTTKITKDVLIASEPTGATVYIDGDKVGETPLKIKTFFTWNKDEIYNSLLRRVIQVRKDGYESQVRDLLPIDTPNIQFFLIPEITKGKTEGQTK